MPANGRVILMHFVVQEVNRAGSRAAAERLVQPAGGHDALTADERQGVRNFNVPADGQGTVGALPALTGRVEGHAFEGDHATPARSAQVQVKSLSALFGRTWTTYTGTQGEFAVAGQITDSSTSMPIPVGVPAQINATHGVTQLAAPTYTASFADGATLRTRGSGPLPRLRPHPQPAGLPDHNGGHHVLAYRSNSQVNGISYVDADNLHVPRPAARHLPDAAQRVPQPGHGATGQRRQRGRHRGRHHHRRHPRRPTGAVTGTVRFTSGAPWTSRCSWWAW